MPNIERLSYLRKTLNIPLDPSAGLLTSMVRPRLDAKSVGQNLFLVKMDEGLFTVTDGRIAAAFDKGIKASIFSEVKDFECAWKIGLPMIPFAAGLKTAKMRDILNMAMLAPEKLLSEPDVLLAAAARDGLMQSEDDKFENVKIIAIADWLRRKLGSFTPQIAITLGSGLGGLGNEIAEHVSIPYTEIPFMPQVVQQIEGHKKNLKFGILEGKNVVAMEGRIHPYEGWPLNVTVRILRALKVLGANIAVITNATGVLHPQYNVGDIVFHFGAENRSGKSIFSGEKIGCGPLFTPVGDINDSSLLQIAKESADDVHGLTLHEGGLYLQLMGRDYESKGLIASLVRAGYTNVGMSSYHEVLAAINFGYRVLWYSFCSNYGAGLDPSGNDPSHSEVLESCERAKPFLSAFVKGVLRRIK